MTEERDERMVAALESIAVSLERLSLPVAKTENSGSAKFEYTMPSSWPGGWSMTPVTS